MAEKIKEDIRIRDIKIFEKNCIILGIPRGGVVVAKAVADELGYPLDIVVVKKLGAPNQEELAIGAIGATPGSVYLNERLIADLGIGRDELEEIKELKREEIKRREKLYRQNRPALGLKGKMVIIADDGAATGATVISAAREVWQQQPKKVIIALPLVAKDALEIINKEADEVIYLSAPLLFYAVGQFYEEFPQVEDREVIDVISKQ